MRRLAAITACLAALVVAAAADATVSEIGTPSNAPFPPQGCPQNCTAVGHVTGIQTEVGSDKDPYTVPQAGSVVAFTVEVGKPTSKQVGFFRKTFKGNPEARLAVFKVTNAKKSAYKLIAQTSVFQLGSYLGSTPSFALPKPLSVPARSVLALTVPTWAPLLATCVASKSASSGGCADGVPLASSNTWLSDRAKCDNRTLYAAQQSIGRTRNYKCTYTGARLLFSATFVPTPTQTPSSSKG